MAKNEQEQAPPAAADIKALLARMEAQEQKIATLEANSKQVRPLSVLEKRHAALAVLPQPQRTAKAAGYEGPLVAVTLAEAQLLNLVQEEAAAKSVRVLGLYADEKRKKFVALSCDAATFKALAALADSKRLVKP